MDTKRLKIIACALSAALIAGVIAYFAFLSDHEKSNPKRFGIDRLSDNQFSDFKALKQRLPEKSEEVSLVAVGDIMPSRGVANRIRAHNDFNYPFLKTRDYLKTGDIVFGNLESPVTPGRQIQSKEMVFRTDPGFVEALREAGFSVLSLANNHTPNFGEKGLQDTFHYLGKAGIKHAGAGKNEQEAYSPVYIERKGIKFAFLAYNDKDVVSPSYGAHGDRAGTAFMDTQRMTKAVKAAKQKADFVIVSMHAGREYTEEPNRSQVNFARAAVDAGAELVIGHHPHVVQTAEKYKGKYIFYSLGNFVFDQMWSRATREGLIVKASFNKSGVTKFELQPVFIEDYAQPQILEGRRAEEVLERLRIPLSKRSIFAWSQKAGTFESKGRKAIYNGQAGSNFKVSKSAAGDLNKNSARESYSLRDGRLRVFEKSGLVWESPADWWIDDFVLADSTGDGAVNINLSVWKAGNYGNTKPFWVEENDQSIKNHFFVLSLGDERVKAVWQSSNLDRPNYEFLFSDIDGDGQQELVVLEGDYFDGQSQEGKYVAVWKWKEWGFYNEWRSPAGKYGNLAIERVNGNSFIVVDTGN